MVDGQSFGWSLNILLMKLPAFGILIASLLAMASCTPIRIALDPGLQGQSSCYPVQGRQQLRLKPRLQYGPYSTIKVRRGAVTSYQVNFRVRFSGATQRMRILQRQKDDAAVDTIMTYARFKQSDVPLWQGRIALPLSYSHLMTGEIRCSGEPLAEFVMFRPETTLRRQSLCGHLDIPGQPLIEIHSIRTLEGNRRWLGATHAGLRYEQDGRVLGQISLLNRGEVCLASDLQPRVERCLAAMSTALLLKQNLE